MQEPRLRRFSTSTTQIRQEATMLLNFISSICRKHSVGIWTSSFFSRVQYRATRRHLSSFTVDGYIHHRHLECLLSLLFDDGVEFTLVQTCAALDTFGLIDDMDFLGLAADTVNRANLGTQGATHALFIHNNELKQIGADASGALLIDDVRTVFVFKNAHGRQNRVRHGLTQTTQGGVLDVHGQGTQFFQVFLGTLTMGDFLKGSHRYAWNRYGKEYIYRRFRPW